jgi:uncharacterized protein YaaN involved in tellurite resistance
MSQFTLDIAEIKREPESANNADLNSVVDPEIRKQAEQNVLAIFEGNFEDPNERQAILKPLDDFGQSVIDRSATRNKLLSSRLVDLSKGGEDARNVGTNLSQLNMQIKDLDPSVLDFAKKGFLGKIFNPVRKYFNKYQKSDAAIADIVQSLEKGSTVLKNDNTTLVAEEAALTDLTKKLTSDIELGRLMDEAIEAQILKAEIEGEDPEKIKFVREEILLTLRQRIMDMQQMVVVNQQGIISMNIIQRNNKELIRGVDRAKNVTITALRSGVMVANALYNQKVLIKKTQILNETTENIIESTSRMLKEQGSEIQRQSTESMISIDVLKRSFADALTAIEEIRTYRENALPKMQESISTFREMAEEGQAVVDRLERDESTVI